MIRCRAAESLADGLRNEADPEYRLLSLVEQFHLPFGILLQAARNAAEQIAADLGHFGPRRLAALEFGALIGRAGVAAMADPETPGLLTATLQWQSLPGREFLGP